MSIVRSRVLFALLAALCAPLAASAQSSPAVGSSPTAAPAGMHHHHHKHHRKSFGAALRSLNLTSDQQAQLSAFRSQEQKANLNADAATKEANAAKMRGQVEGILTADQKAQLHSQMHRSGSHSGTMPMSQPSPASR